MNPQISNARNDHAGWSRVVRDVIRWTHPRREESTAFVRHAFDVNLSRIEKNDGPTDDGNPALVDEASSNVDARLGGDATGLRRVGRRRRGRFLARRERRIVLVLRVDASRASNHNEQEQRK